MCNHPLAGLEPACVMNFFEQICSIPHGSYHTKPISDFLVHFAQERGLKYRQDEANNVIIWKAGTPGYEDHPAVILQGHMDMVCEKDPDCTIDFMKDGLDLTHNDEIIYANGTTLGGDDGIAVAFALAVLDSKDVPHPPLEVLITTDEEVGMLGAQAVDLSDLKGRMLINIDSEDEGIFTVSCAGGARTDIVAKPERKTVYGPVLQLGVDGLQGGHSGGEINKNRGNANKIMGMLLAKIQEKMPLCLVSLEGGSKDNAIPRSCRANAVAMSLDLQAAQEAAAAVEAQCKEMFSDPGVTVTVKEAEAMGGLAMNAEDTKTFTDLVNALPNAVQAMSTQIEGLVETSLNMGIAKVGEDGVSLTFSVRSCINAEKDKLLAKLKEITLAHGYSYSQHAEYPAWEYQEKSHLRDVMVDAYRTQYGKDPKVEAIHAGLECGLLGNKIPGLDSASMGPQMYDVHTSRERLEIASTERTWKLLLAILERL